MSQQLNLYHAGLQRPRDWRARHSLALLAGTAAAALLAGQSLSWHAGTLDSRAAALEQSAVQRQAQLDALKGGRITLPPLASARPSVPAAAGSATGLTEGPGLAPGLAPSLTSGLAAGPAPARLEAELQRLRALDAGQRRVRGLLDTGQAGRREGYSAHLLALARQARPEVWLTGVVIDPVGEQLELHGRLAQPAALPAYLRQLAQEPAFAGRRFAQMSLRRPDGSSPAGADSPAPAAYAEFSLRSQISAAGSPGPERVSLMPIAATAAVPPPAAGASP